MEKLFVILAFGVLSTVGCGGAVEGDDVQPSTPRSSTAGSAGALSASGPGSHERSNASPRGAAGAGGSVNVAQAGALPRRDPNLPGVDYDDGSWVQLGWPGGTSTASAGEQEPTSSTSPIPVTSSGGSSAAPAQIPR